MSAGACNGALALPRSREITRASGGNRAALGALFTVASVLLSAVGSVVASRNRRRARSC